MLGRYVRTALLLLAAQFVLVPVIVLAVAWSGLFDVAATAPFGPTLTSFIHYTMEQSVRHRAAQIVAPPLDDPALVLKGAAHYQTGCAPCHGSPANPRSAVERHADPAPPPLYAAFSRWQPRELFWIVKHGIKMTAMPPWPAQTRDDEVWAMVAFLGALPQLDAKHYAELAMGPQKASAAADSTNLASLERPIIGVVANCLRCHGSGDRLRESVFPRLNGLSVVYITRELRAFREGTRLSGFMQPVAAGLSDADMQAVAAYLSHENAAPPASADTPAPPATPLQDQGARIAHLGTVAGRFPPCVACHTLAASERNPAVPDLSGQSERYLREQLMAFKEGDRVDADGSFAMARIAQRLNQEDIDAATAYFASLPRR